MSACLRACLRGHVYLAVRPTCLAVSHAGMAQRGASHRRVSIWMRDRAFCSVLATHILGVISNLRASWQNRSSANYAAVW